MKEHPDQGDRNHDAGIVYTLRVVRQFRGARAPILRIFTERNAGGEHLSVGKTYVVFAREGDRKHPLWVGCLLTKEIQDVEAAARMLESVRQQKGDVTLGGRAEDHGTPVAGAKVNVRGPGGNLNLTTDHEGRFEAKLQPGKYNVDVRGPEGRPMRQTIYNTMPIDAEHFVTEPGECVDLVFEYESP